MVSIDATSTIVQCGRSGHISSFSRGGSKGCDASEREPGIDDDDWDPAGLPRIAPYVREPPPVPRSRSRGVDRWWTEILVPARDPVGALKTQQETPMNVFVEPSKFSGYHGPWSPFITGVLGRDWMRQNCPM
jgi:hypothetical protein